MTGPVVDILMYHSISDTGGPTSIAPGIFAEQMQAIADAGVPVIRMNDWLAAQRGGPALPGYSIIITFDDGLCDFADAAMPVLERHDFGAIVYLATGFIGRFEGWQGSHTPPLPIMDWSTIRDLAHRGVDFGSHTVSHPDLNALDTPALQLELATSRAEIETNLGGGAMHFAPPYGRANAQVRATIATRYDTSVGTRLGRAGPGSDPYDLPRLEMFYFTDPARWRAHLAGRGATYLARRKALRTVRDLASRPWARV